MYCNLTAKTLSSNVRISPNCRINGAHRERPQGVKCDSLGRKPVEKALLRGIAPADTVFKVKQYVVGVSSSDHREVLTQ